MTHAKSFQSAEGEWVLSCSLHDCLGVLGPYSFVGDVDLKLSTRSAYSPVEGNGGVLGPPFPVVHNHLLCLGHFEGEVLVLAPHGQVSDLLPIGCLIVVGDHVYHWC